MDENEVFFRKASRVLAGFFVFLIPSFILYKSFDDMSYAFKLYLEDYYVTDGVIKEELYSGRYYSYIIEYKDYNNDSHVVKNQVSSSIRRYDVGDNVAIRYIDGKLDEGRMPQELSVELIMKALVLPCMALGGIWLMISNIFDGKANRIRGLLKRFKMEYANEHLLIIHKSVYNQILHIIGLIISLGLGYYLLSDMWIGMDEFIRFSSIFVILAIGYQIIKLLIEIVKKPFYSFDLSSGYFYSKGFSREICDILHIELTVVESDDAPLHILKLRFIDNDKFEIDKSGSDEVLNIGDEIAHFIDKPIKRV